MTVTLELKPEVEDRIKAEAVAHGLSVEAYIQRELESKLVANDRPNEIPYDEWLNRFNDFLKSHDYIKAPPLSDEAVERESIYREREDEQL
jgi:predicted HicB family RNase H-like nuclease